MSGPGLLAQAPALADLAGKARHESDTTGRLSPAVVVAVLDAGFARHFVAGRWGGAEGSYLEACRATVQLGRACPSSAWLGSLAATIGRMAGYLPEDGQRELWRAGPDSLVVGSLLPLGAARPADGGWLVQGEWPYISSVEFSDWALVLARTPVPGGPRFFLVPRDAYGIDETWSNLGLRATGSHTLRLPEVFIPGHRSFDRAGLDRGVPEVPGPAALDLPLETVAGLAFLPAMVGAGQAVVDAWSDSTSGRFGSGRLPADERGAYDLTLARASGAVRAAEALMEGVARRVDDGEPEWTPLAVAECARDAAYAADLLTGAATELGRFAGTGAFNDGSRFQARWRDLHSGTSHVILGLARAAHSYGQAIRTD